MKKAFLLVVILFVSVISTACINNFAVQELNNKAKAYLDKGDFENAISRLKSSIDLDSTIFETHYNLGIAYTQAEQYTNAIETFENAIKLKPSFPDTYYSLAVSQENFAKGLIDGSIDPNGETNEETIDQNSDTDDSAKDKDKELTPAEKALVVETLNKAIKSYSLYLEKGSDIEDKQEVQEKIEYLKTMIDKYSNPIQ